MRIVLDTNVIVSALLVQGSIPDQVLETVISGRARTVIDGRIMREYRTVLARPEFNFSAERVADLLVLLDASEWIIADPLRLDVPDETDLPFLEVAVAGGVDAIVTGNTADFELPRSRAVAPERSRPQAARPDLRAGFREGLLEIPLLTPRQYLDLLAGRR